MYANFMLVSTFNITRAKVEEFDGYEILYQPPTAYDILAIRVL